MKLRMLPLLVLAGASWAFAPASKPAAPVLPFIEDDYARGLSEARARKLPLFIESWAPW